MIAPWAKCSMQASIQTPVAIRKSRAKAYAGWRELQLALPPRVVPIVSAKPMIRSKSSLISIRSTMGNLTAKSVKRLCHKLASPGSRSTSGSLTSNSETSPKRTCPRLPTPLRSSVWSAVTAVKSESLCRSSRSKRSIDPASDRWKTISRATKARSWSPFWPISVNHYLYRSLCIFGMFPRQPGLFFRQNC